LAGPLGEVGRGGPKGWGVHWLVPPLEIGWRFPETAVPIVAEVRFVMPAGLE
jgi:hypothetical protein